MNPECVVVDANIAFKALVSQRGDLRDRLDPSANAKFYSPVIYSSNCSSIRIDLREPLD